MVYFVTGATGFIGRFLIERLLEREGDIHVLVRKGSRRQARGARRGLGAAGAHQAGRGRPVEAGARRLQDAGSRRTRARSTTSSTSPRSTT